MKTKVIFRKFKDGDVFALFPEIPGTYDPYTCLSYMHVGQHGSTSVDVVDRTKPASPEEYADLKAELENYGSDPDERYDLEIVYKFTQKHQEAREKELERHK